GQDLLAARVGQADRVRLLAGGMAEQDLLDLERRHVDPTALDHLLDAAAEPEPPVVADETEVAGDQKAVGVEGGGVDVGVLVDAGGEMDADEDLAELAGRR